MISFELIALVLAITATIAADRSMAFFGWYKVSKTLGVLSSFLFWVSAIFAFVALIPSNTGAPSPSPVPVIGLGIISVIAGCACWHFLARQQMNQLYHSDNPQDDGQAEEETSE